VDSVTDVSETNSIATYRARNIGLDDVDSMPISTWWKYTKEE
jgi:hypothetical protein